MKAPAGAGGWIAPAPPGAARPAPAPLASPPISETFEPSKGFPTTQRGTIHMSKKRRQHSPNLKARVGLEALKGIEPIHVDSSL